MPDNHIPLTPSVFRAIDDARSTVAACKVVNLFISPTLGHGVPNAKELQKEVQVHKSLSHDYILKFIHHELVPQEREAEGEVPGLYMLLELAVGGDLFDKIGECACVAMQGRAMGWRVGSVGACAKR
jgi:serine/threonine-protein kinase Chk1